MKSWIKIYLLFALCTTAFSQDQTLKMYADSVRIVIIQTTNDTIRMENLFNLSDYHIQSNRDTSLILIEQAMGIANKLKQPLWLAQALSLKAFILMAQENYPPAIRAVNEAMLIARDEKNEINACVSAHSEFPDDPHKFRLIVLLDVLHQLGNINSSVGHKDEAIANFKEEIHISELLNGSYGTVTSNMNIGSIFLGKGMLDSALMYSKKALANAEITGNKADEGIILRNIGAIYFRQKKQDTATHYYWKSLASSKIYNNLSSECSANISLAQLYESTLQADSMMHYARAAYKTATLVNSPTRIDISYALVSAAHKMIGNIDSAFYYLSISKTYGDSLNIDRIEKLTQFQNINFEEQMKLEKAAQENIAFRNKIRTIGLFTGLGLLSILTFTFYRNNQQKKKANKALEATLTNLKSTQAQLIQSEKMASLGELTAGIAHEIQNPLNFVNNFSEVSTELVAELKAEIKKGNNDDAIEIANDLTQNLEKINHHGKRAADIVKGMLQHSRTSSGQKELTDINALADEYLRLAYHGLRAKDKSFNAKFETHLDSTLPKVNVVPQDIGRVLLNLINNAFYAVSEKWKVESTKSGSGYEPTVSVSTKNFGDRIEISVGDNGNGIPDSIKEKIFQPFFTTKPTGQGTGLGLSLSYDIVKAHGGELMVETLSAEEAAQAGKEGGSEFIILLSSTVL